MISKCTKSDTRSTLQIVSIVYILKCLYVIICSEFYTTLNDNYISLSFCNTLSFSATISVVILDRVFEFYEGNITIVYPNFMNGLYLNVNNFCYVFFGEGGGSLHTLLMDTKLFHLSVPCWSLLNFRSELA